MNSSSHKQLKSKCLWCVVETNLKPTQGLEPVVCGRQHIFILPKVFSELYCVILPYNLFTVDA